MWVGGTDEGLAGAPPAVVDGHYRTNLTQGSRSYANYFVYSISVLSSVVPTVFPCPPGNGRPAPCSISFFLGLKGEQMGRLSFMLGG